MKYIYWLLPILLLVPQVMMALNSTTQIRYEELAESVRNVFWLANKLSYDTISSSFTWYGLLLITYKIFGFSLYTAKIIRIIISLISLYCLAALLKKYLKPKLSWLPLLAIGLSPTMLYFNTFQSTYGMDLQFFPICLYLIMTLNLKRAALLGLVIAFAWVSYSAFIYYLPVLAVYYLWKLKKQKILNITTVLITFLIPILAVYLWVQNVNEIRLLRGNGFLELNSEVITDNLSVLYQDLFLKGESYHFELKKVEFSDYYPMITLAMMILLLSFRSASWRRGIFHLHGFGRLPHPVTAGFAMTDKTPPRWALTPGRWIGAVVFVFILSLTVYSLTGPLGFGGMRRATFVLVAFYALYVFSWKYIFEQKFKSKYLKWAIIAVFLLVPIHHLAVFPTNLYLLKDPSFYANQDWFKLADTPDKSLELLIEKSKQDDLPLVCAGCRYQEVYAAVKGSCLWNKLKCNRIYMYDVKTGKWEENLWQH